jgi:hypothetical protein
VYQKPLINIEAAAWGEDVDEEVEEPNIEAGGTKKRMQLDRSLLAVLADRWRPEMHTFHLPCGEMSPTLHDVSYLLGLPITGEAVGPVAVPPTWRAELQEMRK